MQLSPEDAALFFKLMPALQVFANRKLQIIKGIEDVEQYKKTSDEQRVNLRNAFYEKPELIDVLLPFKGKIIYDGLIEGYNILFGQGVVTSMSNTYRAAKQQGKIIESLDPGWQPPEPKIVVRKNWKPILDELREKASKLRASGGDAAVLGLSFSLIRASLDFAQKASETPDDLDGIETSMQKVQRAFDKLQDSVYCL